MLPEQLTTSLESLYEQDETAWLEQTAALVEQGRFDEIDREHLMGYLADMARRDKRELFNRLVVLLCHYLKWQHQPDQRTNSWRGTIKPQRRKLRLLVQSGSLRNHAEEIFAEAYKEAREQAAAETGLGESVFPANCAMTLDEILAWTA